MTNDSSSGTPAELLLSRFLLARSEGNGRDLGAWLEALPKGSVDPDLVQQVRRLHDHLGSVRALLELPRDAEGSPAKSHREGELIGGDFDLVRYLGGGGMGDVWEAHQRSLRRPVALKLIRPQRLSREALERFGREARAGARLSHPGVVMTLDHDLEGKPAWIALELVPGGRTLGDFIAERARQDNIPHVHDREVANLIAEVAEALDFAHEQGVIHRDIKPGNILLAPTGKPKISDFGLALVRDESLTDGDPRGTVAYMSPEQLGAKRTPIDHRTDVFSLGVVLYESLTLRKPFAGDSTAQIALQITQVDPPDPRSLRSRLPLDLAVIVSKALEKQPSRRYATMAELAADLRRYLENEPIQARPPSTLYRGRKWVRRNKVSALAFAGSVVLLCSTGVIFWLFKRQRESDQINQVYRMIGNSSQVMRGTLELRTRGLEVPPGLRFYEIDALIATFDSTAAIRKLRDWLEEEQGQRGPILARLGALTLSSDEEEGRSLLQQALSNELSEADRCYVLGLLAPTVPRALEQLEHSVRLAPTHYHAAVTYLMTLMLSGRTVEARKQGLLFRSLYPEDPRGRLAELILEGDQQDPAFPEAFAPGYERALSSLTALDTALGFEAMVGLSEARVNELEAVRMCDTPEVVAFVKAAIPHVSSLWNCCRLSRRGLELIGSGQCREAEEVLTEALAIDPGCGLTHFMLGTAIMEREIPDPAVDRAAKLDSAVAEYQKAATSPSLFPGVPNASLYCVIRGENEMGTRRYLRDDNASQDARTRMLEWVRSQNLPVKILRDITQWSLSLQDPILAHYAILGLQIAGEDTRSLKAGLRTLEGD